MRTPLAYIFLYGVVFLLITGGTLKAQNSLPNNYLAVWDKNDDEKITHSEFYTGLSSTEIFKSWDNNKDAKLDRQEVYEGLRVLWSNSGGSASIQGGQQLNLNNSSRGFPTQQDFARIFKEADLNRNQSLNKAEFCTFIFRQLDSDASGSLSFLEAGYSRLTSFSIKGW